MVVGSWNSEISLTFMLGYLQALFEDLALEVLVLHLPRHYYQDSEKKAFEDYLLVSSCGRLIADFPLEGPWSQLQFARERWL